MRNNSGGVILPNRKKGPSSKFKLDRPFNGGRIKKSGMHELNIYGRKPVSFLLNTLAKNRKGKILIKSIRYTSAFAEHTKDLFNVMLENYQDLMKEASPKYLDDKLGEFANHQGICVDVMYAKKGREDFEEFLNNSPKDKVLTGFVLDRISDLFNFGPIIRCGYAFGVDFFVTEEVHSTKDLNKLNKSSAGYFVCGNVFFIDGLASFLKRQKKNNFTILGLDSLESNKALYLEEINYDMGNRIFVLGSESSGMRNTVATECDFFLHIPMKDGIDSLNVSNAGAIVMYQNYLNLKSGTGSVDHNSGS